MRAGPQLSMNKTLLRIASILLVPSLIVADPATVRGFAGGALSRAVGSSISSLETSQRLDQEALASVGLSSLQERFYGSKVPHGYKGAIPTTSQEEGSPALLNPTNIALAGLATVVGVFAADAVGLTGVGLAGAVMVVSLTVAGSIVFLVMKPVEWLML